jgi:hypothetical protein
MAIPLSIVPQILAARGDMQELGSLAVIEERMSPIIARMHEASTKNKTKRSFR